MEHKTITTPEQEAALRELTEQAQKLDMGYGKDPTGLTPQTTDSKTTKLSRGRTHEH